MPAPLPRPTLLPGLHRLWRSSRRLQLGLDPARAVVLELADASAARMLDLLDGTRSERAVIAEAALLGISEADSRALLDSLRRAGLVIGSQSLLPHNLPPRVRHRLAAEAAALALRGVDSPAAPAKILRRRANARVMIVGRGSMVHPIAVALAQAGVGHVAPPTGSDSNVLAKAIAELAPGTRTDPLLSHRATFAVQVGNDTPAVLAAAGYARRRLAHLALWVRDGTVVVGPLVPPAGLPCLHCLDLHRKERDPEWPVVAAQLASATATAPCGAATALAGAGMAAAEVLNWIDGGSPGTLGASLELATDGQWRRRTWSPHPECSCVRRAQRRSIPAAQPRRFRHGAGQ